VSAFLFLKKRRFCKSERLCNREVLLLDAEDEIEACKRGERKAIVNNLFFTDMKFLKN